jgi:hypothetical protein
LTKPPSVAMTRRRRRHGESAAGAGPRLHARPTVVPLALGGRFAELCRIRAAAYR